MGLGHNDPWVESHMWPQQTWGQRSSRGQWPLVQVFTKKGSLYPHTLICFVGLGPSVSWVESHMWPQPTDLGSKVILGSMTFGWNFLKKRVPVSTYFYVFSNLIFTCTMIAKVCDRESSRDLWFENHLVGVFKHNLSHIILSQNVINIDAKIFSFPDFLGKSQWGGDKL